MPVTFVDYYQIDPSTFSNTGAFNLYLDCDSKLYIDPLLIRKCTIPAFSNSASTITDYFSKVVRLVKLSKKKGDVAWESAKRLLTFREIKGTCLGYSSQSNSGNSIGDKISSEMVDLAKELIDLGSEDPIIFEVATFIKKGIGSDRVSDILTNILLDEIYSYSSDLFEQLDFSAEVIIKSDSNDIPHKLAKNPFSNDPILFVPFSVLSALPVINSCFDIEYLCSINSITRNELSKYIRFDEKKGITKDDIENALRTSPRFGSLLSTAYVNSSSAGCSFNLNQYELTVLADLESSNINIPSFDSIDVISFVNSVNNSIKNYIEEKGGYKLFYQGGQKADEKHVQEVYRLAATFLCKAYDVDISPETNSGCGPVDFKYSRGYEENVLVEIKLTSNTKIKDGLLCQLPIYSSSTDSKHSILLVVDLEEKGFDRIIDLYNSQDSDFRDHFSLFTIDGNKRESASKARFR